MQLRNVLLLQVEEKLRQSRAVCVDSAGWDGMDGLDEYEGRFGGYWRAFGVRYMFLPTYIEAASKDAQVRLPR